MKILFAGSPSLALPSLEAVSAEYEVVGVLTNPDKPAGRGRAVKSTPVKERALALGLTILQPEKLDEDFHKETASLGADLLVVVAYGKIFPESFLALFPKGGINLHPSLLPKYRGPSPINAAIKDGVPETGVTVQRLAKKMDCGNILAKEKITLSNTETAESLSEKAGLLGSKMLLETLKLIEEGRETDLPQWDGDASYCFLISPEEADILWSSPAKEICCQIRAFYPWPKARTLWKGKTLYLLDASVYSIEEVIPGQDSEGPKPQPGVSAKPSGGIGGDQGEDTLLRPSDASGGSNPPPGGIIPGKVLSIDKREGILVQTGEGILAVKKLQIAGKNPLTFREFLNGVRDFPGAVLGGDG